MTAFTDEKTPLRNGPVEDISERQRPERGVRHRFKKIIAVVGLAIIFWSLVHAGGRWRKLHRVIDTVDGRERRISTGAKSLNGDFDLFDLLSIKSISGSLNLRVHPQPADEQNPVPAELWIESLTGSVSIDFPAINAPERDYRVSIDCKHGSINGQILHGQKTSIASRTGSIAVELTPFAADDYGSSIRTSTKTGSQHIFVLSPAKPGVPIHQMSSVHSTKAGSLNLHYPKEWEGTIEGDTKVGSLNLHGENLEIIRDDFTFPVGRYVLAKKGNGNSTLNFHVGTGSANIYFD